MRLNISSLAYGWIIAICFLGLISVWTQPPAVGNTHSNLIELTDLDLPADYRDLEHLKAAAWCALESNQTAVLKLQGEERRFRGSMALAPHWHGQPLQQGEQSRLENCVALRVEHYRSHRDQPASERAALAFLFSDL